MNKFLQIYAQTFEHKSNINGKDTQAKGQRLRSRKDLGCNNFSNLKVKCLVVVIVVA